MKSSWLAFALAALLFGAGQASAQQPAPAGTVDAEAFAAADQAHGQWARQLMGLLTPLDARFNQFINATREAGRMQPRQRAQHLRALATPLLADIDRVLAGLAATERPDFAILELPEVARPAALVDGSVGAVQAMREFVTALVGEVEAAATGNLAVYRRAEQRAIAAAQGLLRGRIAIARAQLNGLFPEDPARISASVDLGMQRFSELLIRASVDRTPTAAETNGLRSELASIAEELDGWLAEGEALLDTLDSAEGREASAHPVYGVQIVRIRAAVPDYRMIVAIGRELKALIEQYQGGRSLRIVTAAERDRFRATAGALRQRFDTVDQRILTAMLQ